MDQHQASGIYNVLKPVGMTSHDVVDFMRDLTGQRRVGHAGTLDPAAAGVLVVMTGRYTRLSPYLTACDKTYRVEITFGLATDTGDADGKAIDERDASHVTADAVAAVLRELVGLLLMKPHRFSAAKVEGRKAYEIARGGDEPELRERPVMIYKAELLRFYKDARPRALVEFRVGKGAYVRSLAELVGAQLDTCAFASFVLRTRSGPVTINQSLTLDELRQLAEAGRLAEVAVDPGEALSDYPQVLVNPEQARLLANGTPVSYAGGSDMGQIVTLWADEHTFIGVAEVRGSRPRVLQPRTILLGAS